MVSIATDSASDLPADVIAETGVVVAPARVAFSDHNMSDDEVVTADFYAKMSSSGETPLPSAPDEDLYIAAFENGLAQGEAVLCLLMPFDMIPSFTNANAARVDLKDKGTVKVCNPGVGSAGLCSLIVSLHAGAKAGWDVDKLLAAIEDVAPRSDVLFVPADVRWLEQAGRLKLVEEKLGTVDDGIPVLRTGTRITGVALAGDRDEALRVAVGKVGERAGAGTPVIVTVDHAADPAAAEKVAALAQERLNVARLIVTELSPTYGSQLGPGAVGIGVAPVLTV